MRESIQEAGGEEKLAGVGAWAGGVAEAEPVPAVETEPSHGAHYLGSRWMSRQTHPLQLFHLALPLCPRWASQTPPVQWNFLITCVMKTCSGLLMEETNM